MGLIHLSESDLDEAREIAGMIRGDAEAELDKIEKFAGKFISDEAYRMDGMLMFMLGMCVCEPDNEGLLECLGIVRKE
jgi:hypothetical protein